MGGDGAAADGAAADGADHGPAGTQGLGRARLVRWAHLVAARLEAARAELDALNVFPVPDGDTGTNLSLTVSRALADVAGPDDVARALLVQARGSSGVIASQLVRGWTDVLLGPGPDGTRLLDGPDGLDGPTVARALVRGDAAAWQAVAEPVEGTVLTVSRAAAEAATRAAQRGEGTADVVAAAVAAARSALRATPTQLGVLASAGVVDSGGSALLLALEALDDVLAGRGEADAPRHGTVAAPDVTAHGAAGLDLDPDGPAYEVMYLLAAPDGSGDRLRDALAQLGDSVVVVGGGGLWHAHVHTDDPGDAVEQGVELGRPHDVRITHFLAAAGSRQPTVPQPTNRSAGRAVVVVGVTGDATAVVVPSESPVQALAALRALQTLGAGDGDPADAACEAVAGCRPLALHDASPEAATRAVEDLLGEHPGGADLVTLVPGRDGRDLADAVAGRLRERHPLLSVEVVGGGQASPLLWVGAE
jgi:uncharacterized protein